MAGASRDVAGVAVPVKTAGARFQVSSLPPPWITGNPGPLVPRGQSYQSLLPS